MTRIDPIKAQRYIYRKMLNEALATGLFANAADFNGCVADHLANPMFAMPEDWIDAARAALRDANDRLDAYEPDDTYPEPVHDVGPELDYDPEPAHDIEAERYREAQWSAACDHALRNSDRW